MVSVNGSKQRLRNKDMAAASLYLEVHHLQHELMCAWTLYWQAVQRGLLIRVRQLVEEEGVDVRKPDHEDVTLLHWAAINNRIPVVQCVTMTAPHHATSSPRLLPPMQVAEQVLKSHDDLSLIWPTIGIFSRKVRMWMRWGATCSRRRCIGR